VTSFQPRLMLWPSLTMTALNGPPALAHLPERESVTSCRTESFTQLFNPNPNSTLQYRKLRSISLF
jgi:hypothetical protein